jgi:hypothetical protein
MQKKILAAGIYYECGRDEAECYRMLDRLNREKPELVLVEDASDDFGVIISVRKNTKKLASVSRFDIDAVRLMMKQTKRKSLIAKVESVDFDERYFTLSADFPDVINTDTPFSAPYKWQWDGPLMALPSEMLNTRTAINVLDMALADDSGMEESHVAEYLNMLAKNCRCDVSAETFDEMNAILQRLNESYSPEIRNFRSAFFHLMLTLGSEERIAEFAAWWNELRESEEAFNMTKAWMDALPFALSNRQMTERIDAELVKIDLSLRQLPHRLYRNINDMGVFMHKMIYPSFTREAIQHLFSELMLREMLLERRQEFKLTPIANPIPTPDMSHPVWQAAIDKGWLDSDLQPRLSRTQAALVAYYIAEKLHIKQKWKFFENLWNRRNMKNDYYDALNQQQTNSMLDKIKKLMEETGE